MSFVKGTFQVPFATTGKANKSIKEIEYTDALGEKSTALMVEGYASTMDMDRVGDIVLPNSFKNLRSFIKDNGVMLLQHKSDKPIGRIVYAKTDSVGLYIKAVVLIDRDNIMKSIRTGVTRGFSIGFRIDNAETDIEVKKDEKTGKYIYIFKKIELTEISAVSVPACREALMKGYIKNFKDGADLSDEEYSKNFDLDKKLDYDLLTSIKSEMDLQKKFKVLRIKGLVNEDGDLTEEGEAHFRKNTITSIDGIDFEKEFGVTDGNVEEFFATETGVSDADLGTGDEDGDDDGSEGGDEGADDSSGQEGEGDDGEGNGGEGEGQEGSDGDEPAGSDDEDGGDSQGDDEGGEGEDGEGSDGEGEGDEDGQEGGEDGEGEGDEDGEGEGGDDEGGEDGVGSDNTNSEGSEELPQAMTEAEAKALEEAGVSEQLIKTISNFQSSMIAKMKKLEGGDDEVAKQITDEVKSMVEGMVKNHTKKVDEVAEKFVKGFAVLMEAAKTVDSMMKQLENYEVSRTTTPGKLKTGAGDSIEKQLTEEFGEDMVHAMMNLEGGKFLDTLS